MAIENVGQTPFVNEEFYQGPSESISDINDAELAEDIPLSSGFKLGTLVEIVGPQKAKPVLDRIATDESEMVRFKATHGLRRLITR